MFQIDFVSTCIGAAYEAAPTTAIFSSTELDDERWRERDDVARTTASPSEVRGRSANELAGFRESMREVEHDRFTRCKHTAE